MFEASPSNAPPSTVWRYDVTPIYSRPSTNDCSRKFYVSRPKRFEYILMVRQIRFGREGLITAPTRCIKSRSHVFAFETCSASVEARACLDFPGDASSNPSFAQRYCDFSLSLYHTATAASQNSASSSHFATLSVARHITACLPMLRYCHSIIQQTE